MDINGDLTINASSDVALYGAGNLIVDNNIIIKNGSATETTLISTQTSNINIELPDISDTLIGVETTNTLFNKTILDVSNTVYAKGWIDSSGNTIDAPTDQPPGADYIQVSLSGSDTEWQLLSEANGDLISDISQNTSDISLLKGFTDQTITVGPVSQSNKVDFTTVKDGVDAANLLASSGVRVCVLVMPGIYPQEANPITINQYVSVLSQGTAIASVVIPSDNTTHVFEIQENTTLSGFFIMGANGTGGKGVYFDGAGTFGRALLTMCAITNCETGVYATGGDSILLARELLLSTKSSDAANPGEYTLDTAISAVDGAKVRITDVGIYGTNEVFIGTGVNIVGSDTHVMLGTSFVERCDTGIFCNDNSGFLAKAAVFDNNTIAIELGSDGPLEAIANECTITNSSDFDLVLQTSDDIVKFFGTELALEKFHNPTNSKIDMTFYSKKSTESGFNVVGELRVGHPIKPTESVFGGGDSYILSTVILRNDNLTSGTWVDVTAESYSDTPFDAFSSDTQNNALYIGSDFKFFGFKFKSVTPLATSDLQGALEVEYWSGSDWVDVPFMTSLGSPPYYTEANRLFVASDTSYHVRFRDVGEAAFLELNGFNKIWHRIRIASDIAQIPQCGQIKCHPSRCEINNDGFIEYFGNARPIGQFPFNVNLFRPAGNSPANQDFYLADRISFGAVENSFQGAPGSDVTNRSGATFNIPPDLDTSYPASIDFLYAADNDDSGFVELTLRYDYSQVGSNIYLTRGQAPATSPTEQSITQLVEINNGTPPVPQGVVKFNVDIEQFFSFPASDADGLAWIIIERNSGNPSDTFTGDFNILNTRFRYVRWSDGGHITSYGNFSS